MKIHEFFKVKKVRCVSIGNHNLITVGKEYDVVGVDRDSVFIVNDNDNEDAYLYKHFEPVLDSAENPLQGVELTPEFEAVEPVIADNSVNIQDIGTDILDTNSNIKDTPKFKVGDPVYWGLKSRIFTIHRFMSTNVLEVELDGGVTSVHKDELCPATLENYGKLCSLFERIDFEAPPKELTGSDLARAMLDKGWVSVPCYISDESDYEADNNAFCALIGKFDKCFKELATNYEHEYAVPFDPRTGEPLTESILND